MSILLHPDRIDLAHVSRGGGKPRVTMCDSFRNEGGDKSALERLRKELRLERYCCTTLLDSADYQVQQLDAPNVPAAEMKSAMRWRVKELIDYPVDAAALDVLDIPTDETGGARGHSVFVITARNDVIVRRAQPFNEAGVALQAIDIGELAQRNVCALFELENRALAMLAFDDSGGLLTVTHAGELYAYRHIEISLERLAAGTPDQRAQLLERVALELQRSLDNLDRQFGFLTLAKLLLAPLPADSGLQEYLAQNLYLPVESFDLTQVLDCSAVPDLAQPVRQAQWLRAIGAALRDEPVVQ